MARLGLLAAAFANGTIGVYSLPHPQALAAHHQSKGKTNMLFSKKMYVFILYTIPLVQMFFGTKQFGLVLHNLYSL